MHATHKLLCAAFACAALTGCYMLRPSSGGGQTGFKAPREINAEDIALPAGYRIEPVARELTFPTSVTFDAQGTPYVIEAGYSYGEKFTTPRLLRVEKNGALTEIARGENNGPWTGVVYSNGAFYVAEGGQMKGGRILRISPEGRISALIENLPSFGDHHTNGPAIGRDGQIYFTVGVATNSGVVGEDNFKFGWLKRFPKFHDIPCQDITLSGQNFESPNVLGDDKGKVQTGAFVPFGTTTNAGQVIKGQLPCSGALMRMAPSGGKPELIAWGFRNPFGLAFAPDGQLYITDNGYDQRGSRPVWGAGDVLWRVTPGAWYGWPDYAEGRTLTNEDFREPLGKHLAPVLAKAPSQPPKPAAIFGVHSSADGFDFSRSSRFGYVGEAFVAEFGDQAPTTGKSLHPVGFRVVRVDVKTGHIEDFAANKGRQNGPATKIGGAGFERPVAVRFDPSGNALYVVDFGVMLMDRGGPKPQEKTGVLWRITRQ